jgi:acetyl-CoA carboxylase carboxyltransferase component
VFASPDVKLLGPRAFSASNPNPEEFAVIVPLLIVSVAFSPTWNTNPADAAVEDALATISDNNIFFETKREYAKEMVTGFIRLNGMTVGAVANRSKVYDAEGNAESYEQVLTVDGCKKAADFINFCDAFSIPVLSLTNVTGFEATLEAEKDMARAVAKLTYAFANASVPKVNVIAIYALP